MNYSNLIEGVVVDTSDPQEMGRLRIWCPSIDGDHPIIENLPWALYVTPLAGQAQSYPAGNGAASVGPVSYGIWAIPKIGAQVIVAFLYGDYNQRVYMGSYFRDHGNRSLPIGRNAPDDVPTSDAGIAIEPAASNLHAQFSNNFRASEAKTRGIYERQVAQPADEKTPTEGYSTRVISDKKATGDLDPQTYCITTPGRHALIMQDDPKFARVRIKTAEGHQVILDDANERIYISAAGGRTWVELDVDGHIHMYGAESISMSSGADFNIQALGNVNIKSGKNVNISSAGHARISACSDLGLSGADVKIDSGSTMNFLASGTLLFSGSDIHLNGPSASGASCAESPSITPSSEPWKRPKSNSTRNKNWKE
jgi:Type VI secretion system/phage-baseplate injector OB domain